MWTVAVTLTVSFIRECGSTPIEIGTLFLFQNGVSLRSRGVASERVHLKTAYCLRNNSSFLAVCRREGSLIVYLLMAVEVAENKTR